MSSSLKEIIAGSNPPLNSLIPLGWREILRQRTGLSRNSISKMLRGEMGSDERIEDLLGALNDLIEEKTSSIDNLRNALLSVNLKSSEVAERHASAQKRA